MLIGIAPAGLEKMFFAVGQPMHRADEPPPDPAADEIPRLLAAAAAYGIEFQLPPHE